MAQNLPCSESPGNEEAGKSQRGSVNFDTDHQPLFKQMADKGPKIRAVGFISPQNYPMLVHTFGSKKDDVLRYNYVTHTSLDVIEERLAANPKATECFLGMLYVLEDVCVYGYITPTRVKIVIALDQTDEFLKDADVILIFKALHAAYHDALCNPFLQQSSLLSQDPRTEQVAQLLSRPEKSGSLRLRLDKVAAAANVHLASHSTE